MSNRGRSEVLQASAWYTPHLILHKFLSFLDFLHQPPLFHQRGLLPTFDILSLHLPDRSVALAVLLQPADKVVEILLATYAVLERALLQLRVVSQEELFFAGRHVVDEGRTTYADYATAETGRVSRLR
jgi:hypothetical protein